MRKSLALAVAALSVTGIGALVPATANAATDGGVGVTFTVSSGGLTIGTTPSASPVNLGSAVAGGVVSGSLGSSTVTDTRGNSTGYTVSVASTDLTGTTQGGTGYDLIPATNMVAWTSTVPTTNNALVVVTATHLTQATGVALTAANATSTLWTATDAAGVLQAGASTATYATSVGVTIPVNATPDSYTGTVTQSVL
jgi:hypothetical protein